MDNLTLAYALILLGLVLLVAEIFIPTGGILFVLSVSALIVGVTMTFTSSTSTGLGTLIAVVIVIPILLTAALHYWPKTPIGKRFFLAAPSEDDTLAATPENKELERLRGRYGKTVSALRPAGITDFDGHRVDTLSEGDLIEPGQWVRCIDVRAGRVIVRPVDRPPDLANLETVNFN